MSNPLRPHGLQITRLAVRGISQARILEWVAYTLLKKSKQKKKCNSFNFPCFHSHQQHDISSSTSETSRHTVPTLKLWAVLVSRALTFVNFLKRWLNSHQYGFLRSVLNCPQRLKKTTTRLHSHPSFPESSLISCLSAGLAGLRSIQEKKEVVF